MDTALPSEIATALGPAVRTDDFNFQGMYLIRPSTSLMNSVGA
jgi:hypothetical protein